jgi:hypothetical protein
MGEVETLGRLTAYVILVSFAVTWFGLATGVFGGNAFVILGDYLYSNTTDFRSCESMPANFTTYLGNWSCEPNGIVSVDEGSHNTILRDPIPIALINFPRESNKSHESW